MNGVKFSTSNEWKVMLSNRKCINENSNLLKGQESINKAGKNFV